jgi:ribosome-binding factor A
MSQRTDRVDELLRQEIGRILAKDVQDPHIGFATVTDVETTPDLRHARVWVSVIGGEPERAQAIAALGRSMGFVRHELGLRLRLRRIPALHVALDDSAARGTRVLQILDELEQGHDAAGEALADAPLAESLPTPVARVHRDGDAVEEPAGAGAAPTEGPAAPLPAIPSVPAGRAPRSKGSRAKQDRRRDARRHDAGRRDPGRGGR